MSRTNGSGSPRETPADRRRSKRVAVDLPGRYLLEDGGEFPCTCIDVSVGGVRLRAPQAGPWGSRVIVYIDGIGRLEGYIVRRAPGWFALETPVTARKGERVQERIAWILESEPDESAGRRGPSREVARRPVSLGTLDDRQHVAELTDISRGGAALLTDAALEIGERVRLDDRRARVVRLFPGGAALKFENWAEEPRPAREAEFPQPRARRAAAAR